MGAFQQIAKALVVEDQPLIALDLANTLELAGVKSVRIARTVAEALAAIEQCALDFVTMDLVLSDGKAAPIAYELVKRGVPFVYVSGWELTPDLPVAPWVGKPAADHVLLAAVLAAYGGRIAAE
ncbi:hypothetical protein DMC47_00510 [Nostoc sp. 3335mG]|nr:hypothetical protein DMC47_00510 [Nostoc sp. 3335mG]